MNNIPPQLVYSNVHTEYSDVNVVYNSMIKFLLQYAQRLNILGGLFFWSVYLKIYTKLYKKYTTYLVTLKVKVENCITRKVHC